MMTEAEIARRLTAARSAYVELSGRKPYGDMEPKLTIFASGRVQASLLVTLGRPLRGDGETIEAALNALDDAIAMIPEEVELRKRAALGHQIYAGGDIYSGLASAVELAAIKPLIKAILQTVNKSEAR